MLFSAILVLSVVTSSMTSPLGVKNQSWEEYKWKYGKVYRDVEEDARRFEIWKKISHQVDLNNAKYEQSGYIQEVNMFADMTKEEFQAHFLQPPMDVEIDAKMTSPSEIPFNDLPDSVDWRSKGAVTSVKNQGLVGSSASALGAVEGQWFIKQGKLLSLSEQQVEDCCDECHGGWSWYQVVWEYIKQTGGIETAQDYHRDKQHNCNFDAQKVSIKVKGYKNLSKGSEEALKEAVATIGPISVGINAGSMGFQMYRGGVFYDPHCSPKRINHAVLVVGYGTYNGHDYWLVKNSWGQTWGDRGYIKMARNRDNNCGIASMGAYPLI